MTLATSAGKIHVVGADREQHHVERAQRVLLARRGQQILELAELRRRGSRAIVDAEHPRTIVGHLAAEHAGLNARAGAGQRQEGHGEVRLLDGQRQRGAQLIAVERAMAARAHPARAVTRPIFRRGRRRRSVLAGTIVAIAGAARPEILAAGAAAQKTLEAKRAIQLHGLVGIAFAGGDGIAQARDEHVAHGDLGDHALRGAVAERDIDGGDRDASVGHAQDDFAFAGRLVLAQLSLAVIEGPGADRARRRVAGKDDADAVIARREVILFFAVAVAGLPSGRRTCRRRDCRPRPWPSPSLRCRAPAAARRRARRRRGWPRPGAGNRPRCGTGGSGS